MTKAMFSTVYNWVAHDVQSVWPAAFLLRYDIHTDYGHCDLDQFDLDTQRQTLRFDVLQ